MALHLKLQECAVHFKSTCSMPQSLLPMLEHLSNLDCATAVQPYSNIGASALQPYSNIGAPAPYTSSSSQCLPGCNILTLDMHCGAMYVLNP